MFLHSNITRQPVAYGTKKKQLPSGITLTFCSSGLKMDMFWGFDGIVALNFSLSSEHFAVCHFLSMGENSVIGFGGDIVVILQTDPLFSAIKNSLQ